MNKEEVLDALTRAVVEMNEEAVIQMALLALQSGIGAEEAIEKGLSRGMEQVGKLYDANQYFIPEVVVCADTMYKGLEILRPATTKLQKSKGRIVIGVIEGDTHDIGKNIVVMMLESAGFEIYDLGRNVSPADFINRAREVDADIVAMSSLMTTTMKGMKTVIEELNYHYQDHKPLVMVGGAPVSKPFAVQIGADGYASNAPGAVRIAQQLMQQRRKDGCD
ncbi:MAG TPA: cobalamin-binding protein [Syntrophomonas sp.]|jgi:dimethylamine corrinoid protein|nr:cobalamin-binding protein [Syntrophomonas sp.]